MCVANRGGRWKSGGIDGIAGRFGAVSAAPVGGCIERNDRMGSVVKKRRKRMAKKKHRKLLRKTRVQRRRLGK